jgi:preprotein translocase subunit SecE
MPEKTETKNNGVRLFNYLKEIVNELKKVVWLSRREAVSLTVMVLVVSAIAAAFLGGLDFSFSALLDKVFLR